MSIRIGIIGAGTMATDHANALAGVAGARVVAIADPVVQRAQEVAAAHDARAYADYHDILDGVDAVWICTPPFLHREQAETCAAAGKHLFMEKPLALTLADCRAVIAAAREHGVRLMVGQVFHFYPIFQEAYRRLEAGELGDVVTCWSTRMGYYPPDTMPAWRTDPALSGGFTIENQVHEIDFVNWFGGEPVSVQGTVMRSAPEFPSLDHGMSAAISYRNGAHGQVYGSWRSRIWASQRGIIGTRGTIVIDAWDHLRFAGEGAAAREDEQIVPTAGPKGAVRAEDEHFLRCIERGEQPSVTGEIGMAAVEVALATIASSDENKVVTLAH